MRILNWIFTCILLEGENKITNTELELICNSILEQIKYLKDNYLNKYKTSNWGTIQTTSITSILPILLESYKTDNLYIWAYNEMVLQFSIQVYEDGMFWEQSTMYHAEVLNYGIKAIYFYKYFNKKDEAWFKNVESLADALFYQLMPNLEIEAFGDTDRICAKDIFNRASVLFNNPTYKFVGDLCYDIESLYIFGCNFADKYNNMKALKPEKNVYDGKDSGMYVIKSGWDINDSFTMFTNGSLGSGHGHSDNLHISIGYDGELMLIDSGRYTYREDIPLRAHLKGSFAHNTVVLNDSPYCIPDSSWTYANFGVVLKNYVKHINNFHYLEGGIIGNNPLQVWLRKLIVIDPNIWLIVDEIKADNNNKATLNFHIDPFKEITQKDNTVYIKGTNKSLKIIQDLTPNLQTKPCSLKYNELLNHTVVCYETNFNNNLELITCICDENIEVLSVPLYQSDKETLKQIGQAKKFKISDTESYTIGIYHKEIYNGAKILFCEGIAFHGKCIIIHEKNNIKTYKLMKV